METKVDSDVIEKLSRKMQYKNFFVVPRHNRGGGLALLWKETFAIKVLTSSDNHIDGVVDHGLDDAWRFTGFYGEPETASREHSWNLLRDLSHRHSLPWICLGDFNEIVRLEEKQGWLDRPKRQMQGFRDALDYCGFKDLGFTGFPFTWCNRRPGDHNVWIRLDRGVATVDWFLQFPTSRIHHLECFHSDHRPILLISDAEQKRFYRKGRPFRFEAMWIKDRSCEDVVKQSWADFLGSNPVSILLQKITSCQVNLSTWNRVTFGHVRNTLAKKLKELSQAEESGLYRTKPDQIEMLQSEINLLQVREEAMWKQRSHSDWLKEGDCNTRYFHCRANQRNKHNFIVGLEDELGVWTEDDDQMGRLANSYFDTMFTTSNPTGFDEILSGLIPTVTDEMNNNLNKPYTAEEVLKALHHVAPLTALGPDGMSPIFYKSFWHIVGKDVTEVVLSALKSGTIPDSINSTFIALIPKIKDPRKVSDFRPISLCNVVYKLIAKVLVNLLKLILPYVVSDSQSAFLSGRLITDNVLVAFETLHFLKRKTQGNDGYMALKLDMSKAYDRVEWDFLERAMVHLGFAGSFVATIMSCIKSVSYSVLLNGVPGRTIKPSRGLRQGDSLSPYLFLLCAMGLQGLLHKAESDGPIRGVSICRNGPRVSHLFFADDNVLFCRAKEAEC